MSKHAKQSTKGRHPTDVNAGIDHDADNLDTNQSARSMSSGNDDTTVNQGTPGEAVSAVDEEGASRAFGEPEELSSGEKTSAKHTEEAKSEGGSLLSKTASAIDGQSVKKNLNLVKNKAQDLLHNGREQLSTRYASLSDDVKLRSMMVDDKIKTNPYAYALGAAGLGFILGRALSGKGKKDLDFLVSTVNKINISTLAGYLGMKVEDKDATIDKDEMAKEGYNEKQARRIG